MEELSKPIAIGEYQERMCREFPSVPVVFIKASLLSAYKIGKSEGEKRIVGIIEKQIEVLNELNQKSDDYEDCDIILNQKFILTELKSQIEV
jgi:DTW domain-containing protein YfiP